MQHGTTMKNVYVSYNSKLFCVLDILFKLTILALWNVKDRMMVHTLGQNMLFSTIQRR